MWEKPSLPLVYVELLPWLPRPRRQTLKSFTANLSKRAIRWTAMKGTLSYKDRQTVSHLFVMNTRHVKTFNPSALQTQTLYAYPDPVSPHIATAEVLRKRQMTTTIDLAD